MDIQEVSESLDSIELEQPILVGNYELFSVLGEGGIATTYLGRNLDGGQLVAVKSIQLLKGRHRSHIELFEREAEALRELSHDQIPDVYETLMTEGPESITLYLVQQFIPGRSLEQLVRRGPLSPARVVGIMLSCLKPLEYLHGLRPPLYHRDIKPSNIILRSDNSCVLIDFGAVREALTDPKAAGSSVVGTFGYMAPEQFQGRVSRATDLYSLGATGLELVTGRSPSSFEVKRLKPDFHHVLNVDSHLAAILDLLLEPAEEDRYQSVQSVKRALLRWVADHRDTATATGEHLPPDSSGVIRALLYDPADQDASSDADQPVTRSKIIMVQDKAGLRRAASLGTPPPDAGVSTTEPQELEDADAPLAQLLLSEEDKETPQSSPAIQDWATRSSAEPRVPTREHVTAPSGLDVRVRRHLDSWGAVFNPFQRGYLPVGGVFLALAFLLFAVSRYNSALSPTLPIISLALAVYGLTYFAVAWLRKRSRSSHHFLENVDGRLLGVNLLFTKLGGRYVALDYAFNIDDQPYRGRRVFASREKARPFLQNELPGMVWYDDSNPKKNTLDHA